MSISAFASSLLLTSNDFSVTAYLSSSVRCCYDLSLESYATVKKGGYIDFNLNEISDIDKITYEVGSSMSTWDMDIILYDNEGNELLRGYYPISVSLFNSLNVSNVKKIRIFNGNRNDDTMYLYDFKIYARNKDITPCSDILGLNYIEGLSAIEFNWTNPVDSDFNRVNVYRDSVLISSITGTTYTDTGLESNKEYFYQFKTVDTSGNESIGISRSIKTKSDVDIIPPKDIFNVSYVSDVNFVNFSWINPNDEDFSKVNIYRDSVLIDSTQSNKYVDTELNSDTEYCYKFTTVDILGNESKGVVRTLKTLKEPDFIPPSCVSDLTVAFDEYKNILKWTSPADDDLKEIQIYRDGEYLTSTLNNYFNDIKIKSNTHYEYIVYAVDTSENKSEGVSASVDTGEIDSSSLNIIFGVITDCLIGLLGCILASSKNILLSVLALIAFILGAFYLIGLGKKAVKKSK